MCINSCTTCAYELPGNCGVPEYLALTEKEQHRFWEHCYGPCGMWAPAEEAELEESS